MAEGLDGRQAVPLEEVVLAQAHQLEGLLNVWQRKTVSVPPAGVAASDRLQEKPGDAGRPFREGEP